MSDEDTALLGRKYRITIDPDKRNESFPWLLHLEDGTHLVALDAIHCVRFADPNVVVPGPGRVDRIQIPSESRGEPGFLLVRV